MKRSPDNYCVRFKDLLFKTKYQLLNLISLANPIAQPAQSKNYQMFLKSQD